MKRVSVNVTRHKAPDGPPDNRPPNRLVPVSAGGTLADVAWRVGDCHGCSVLCSHVLSVMGRKVFF